MLSQMYLENIECTIFLCNVFPAWQTQHCMVYFAKKSCLLTMGQHCTGKFFAQYWSAQIKATLDIIFLCKVVLGFWINISQVVFVCNVGKGRSRQHCIGYFPSNYITFLYRGLFSSARLFVDCETIDPLVAGKYSFFFLNFQGFFLFGSKVLECAYYLFCINRFT